MTDHSSEINRSQLSLDWALEGFERYRSEQTSWIHFNREKPYIEHHDPISTYHNALYILALMKTRQVANMQEALRLLDHLLKFRQEGKFPSYLHSYPFVKQGGVQIDLLAPFYQIEKSLPSGPLKEELGEVIRELAAGVSPKDELEAFKMACFAQASMGGGDIPSIELNSSVEMGEALVFASLVQGEFYSHFFKRILSHFHLPTAHYMGPNLREKRLYGSYEVGLVHGLIEIGFNGRHPSQEGAYQMLLPLIDMGELNWEDPPEPAIDGYDLEINPSGFVSVARDIEVKGGSALTICSGPLDFSLVVGDFACQGRLEGKTVVCEATVKAEYDPQTCREPLLSFFSNLPTQTKVFIGGKQATTFELGEEVVIETPHQKIKLVVTSDSATSRFMGQVNRSNRPYESVVTKFDGYDLQLGLRSTLWQVGEKLTMRVDLA